jgi:hypothetical protein
MNIILRGGGGFIFLVLHKYSLYSTWNRYYRAQFHDQRTHSKENTISLERSSKSFHSEHLCIYVCIHVYKYTYAYVHIYLCI